MKKIITFIVLLTGLIVFGQNYPMTSANDGQTFTTCSGVFTDDGGNGSYSSNINDRTITFCPGNPGDLLKFEFTSFNTESCCDHLEVFYGTDTTGAPAMTFNGNLGAFDFFSALPGDCVTFVFNSDTSLTYSGWSANISCVTPCSPPTAALVDDSDVDICSSEATNPGDLTVDFNASASVSNDEYNIVFYEWNWGDGTTSVTGTPIASHTFPDEPGYYVVSLKVRTNNYETDDEGCISGNTAIRYVRVLPPPNFEGTTEGTFDLDCGDTFDLNGIASSQTITQDPPPGNGSDVPLPDTQQQPFDSTIDLTGYFPAGATVNADCLPEVTFNIEHSFVGDIKIFLIAPTGQQIILLDGYGDGPGANNNMGGDFLGYCVRDPGSGPGCPAPYHVINSGGLTWNTPAAETGTPQACDTFSNCASGTYYLQDATYNSSQSMNGLVGAELNGIWTLRIVDYWAIDDGYMDGWSISFPNDCYSNLETVTPILSGGLWTSDGGPAVPEPQVVTNDPFTPTTIDPCPAGADCTGNILQNSTTVGPFTSGGTYTYTFTVEDEFGCTFEKEVIINVDCPCSLELTSAPETTEQAICLGESIVNITYEAGGNATDVIVTGLPAGVTSNFVGGILTISGTPTETGIFNYSVTTVGCDFEITLEGTITINALPEITEITQPIEFCTTSTTTYNFNLTQVEGTLVANPADFDITYYTSQANAEAPSSPIATPDAYPVSATAPTTIYIRVENALTGCYVVTSITVQPGDGPTLSPVNNAIELCDDDFDGVYETNLTELDDLVLNPNVGYDFIYYENYSDMTNDIPIPSSQWNNYGLNGMPNSIWIAAENSEGCRSEAIEIHFEEGQGINLLSGPYQIPFCNGQPVNLTDFEDMYTTESGVDITYHATLNNAQNGNNPIMNETNYTPASAGSVIYVRLEKEGRCPEVVNLQFIAGAEVTHNAEPFDPIEFCSGQTIDITQLESDISSAPGVVFSYFETMTAAQNDSGEITNVTEYEPAGETGSIFVRLEQNDKCPAIVEITYSQRPAPSLTVPSEETLCDEESVEVTATSDDPDATFQWTSETGEILTGTTQTFTDYGTYTVIAVGANDCESQPRTVTISPPAPPTITSIESGDGSITVYAANGGNGPMEYSLDGVLWQSSNHFGNLINGETYTVYVRSDTCVVTSYKITILSVPNFVSPNGDGYNDEWTIRGIEVTPDATIKIFDRYGKIFVDTNFDGNYVWDGKYGGNPLPSGDYWYILNVPGDGIIVPQKYAGHISIRNQ